MFCAVRHPLCWQRTHELLGELGCMSEEVQGFWPNQIGDTKELKSWLATMTGHPDEQAREARRESYGKCVPRLLRGFLPDYKSRWKHARSLFYSAISGSRLTGRNI